MGIWSIFVATSKGTCMGKTLVVCIFLSASSLAFADPLNVSAGLLISWAPLEGNYQTMKVSGATLTDNSTFEALGLIAFIDFKYEEVSIGINGAVTQLNDTQTTNGVTTQVNDPYSISNLDIRLIGKYPFDFGSFTLFPLIGIEKYFCLRGSISNVGFTSDQTGDASAWLVTAGVGADINVNEKLYIRQELTGAFNLTSKRSSSYYNQFSASYQSSTGWEIQYAVGVGFLLY
jgi:hypothetical protein